MGEDWGVGGHGIVEGACGRSDCDREVSARCGRADAQLEVEGVGGEGGEIGGAEEDGEREFLEDIDEDEDGYGSTREVPGDESIHSCLIPEH